MTIVLDDADNRATPAKLNRYRYLTESGQVRKDPIRRVGSRWIYWSGFQYLVSHRRVLKPFSTLESAVIFAEGL